jgi:hypothetical protein
MNGAEHRYVGAPMHDRLICALETCPRQGEMLRIQNRHVDWEKHQIAIVSHLSVGLRNVARPPRLERGTPGLEGRCSIHLSYGRIG